MSDYQDTKLDPNDVPAVVVLVHGTWGRGLIPGLRKPIATWCDEKSDLRKVCQDELGDRTKFVPFSWSGANSPAKRLAASEDLKRRLVQIRNEYPSTPIFLITHSHGGNVAMYCMTDASSRKQVSGLVCFSTPFLHVSARKFGKSADVIRKIKTAFTFALVVVAFTLLTAFVLDIYSSKIANADVAGTRDTVALPDAPSERVNGINSKPESNSKEELPAPDGNSEFSNQFKEGENTDKKIKKTSFWETVLGLWWIITIGLLVFSWPLWAFLSRGFHRLDAWSRNLTSRLSIPSELPFPVLLVRDTGDEASSALGGPQFMSSVVSLFLNAVVAVLRLVNKARAWASAKKMPNVFYWWFGTVVSLVLWMIILDSINLDAGEWLMSLPVIPYLLVLIRTYLLLLVAFLCIVLAFPCFVLIYFFILVLSILLMPFGLQFAASAASLKITAEATPPGKWGLVQLKSINQPEAEIGMQHSTHGDPEALEILKNWFQQLPNPVKN